MVVGFMTARAGETGQKQEKTIEMAFAGGTEKEANATSAVSFHICFILLTLMSSLSFLILKQLLYINK